MQHVNRQQASGAYRYGGLNGLLATAFVSMIAHWAAFALSSPLIRFPVAALAYKMRGNEPHPGFGIGMFAANATSLPGAKLLASGLLIGGVSWACWSWLDRGRRLWCSIAFGFLIGMWQLWPFVTAQIGDGSHFALEKIAAEILVRGFVVASSLMAALWMLRHFERKK